MVVDPMPDEPKMVRAVRLNLPVRMRKGQVRAVRVPFGRIAELGELAEDFPPLEDKRRWEEWIEEVANEPFRTLSLESDPQASSSLGKSAGSLARLMEEKAALPCEECPLFGPCLKTTRHPFSNLVQQYMDYRTRLQSVQERLWQAFLKHYRFLQREGYVDEEGRLTSDGMWASKLRLDQPLLISEAIRSGTLPDDAPALLAGLIALFVMDRERPGDERTSAVLIWKYPDLAGAYFGMSNELQPLQDRLKSWGFAVPVLPFWTMVTVYQWALGDSWEALVELSGMDDGDLAMVVLRTADHLRQIEALHETHPELAACARHGIGLILREPVLVV
jgi:superfamily II RNA helicase